MPATPMKYTPRTPPWLVDENGERIQPESEAHHSELMNEYMAKEYVGLSAPIFGDDIFSLPDPVWALRNLIQQDGLTILHGQPGSYKSFVAMDWAYSLSAPQSTGWMGQPRSKQFRPMYLFTEGMAGLKNRTLAWKAERQIDTAQMNSSVVFVRDRVPLNPDTRDADNPFSQQTASLVKMYNDNRCDILFIDTLANTFVGNENQQQDANSYLRTLSLFLAGGPVVLVHHNKKGENEFRGSTVFAGAVDTLVSMEKTSAGAKLEIAKQKDGPEDFFLHLKAQEHRWQGQYAEQSSIALVNTTADHWMKPVHEDILVLLQAGAMTVRQVSEATGEGPQTVKPRLDKMVQRGKLKILEGAKPTSYTVDEPEDI